MRRFVFYLACVLSTLLCVAAGFGWAISYHFAPELSWAPEKTLYSLGSMRGRGRAMRCHN